jgi:hypothetical protein
MNIKRVAITGLVVFIVFFILEMLVHGVWLQDLYHQTSGIWRPEADMNKMMWLMFIGQAIFAFAFTLIYACGFDPKKARLGQGLRYGLLMALLIAPNLSLCWYVILPIPQILATYWFAASAGEMLVLGLIAGLVYRR